MKTKGLVWKIILVVVVVFAVIAALLLPIRKEEKKVEPNLNPSLKGISTPKPDKLIGGDRDEHGCIGSAGYSWCESKQKCLRIWEEGCGVVKSATGEFLPETKKDCDGRGGKWGIIGGSQKYICNLPTSDAGKRCSNKSDCEGSCIAELSTEDEAKLKVSKEVLTLDGICTPYIFNVGCHPFVSNGKIDGITCVD